MAVSFWTLAFLLPPADAAVLHKSDIVKLDRGREVLCDPHIVQKNGCVFMLLRQKGKIAAPGFLVENASDRRVRVSEGSIHHQMVDFLSDRGVRVVRVGFSDGAGTS